MEMEKKIKQEKDLEWFALKMIRYVVRNIQVKTVKETRLTNCVFCKELLIFFTYLFHD
jgi:hypothetical protein